MSEQTAVRPDRADPFEPVTPAAEVSEASAAPPAPPKKKRIKWRDILPPLILFGFIIAVWYFVAYVMMDEQRRGVALPPPQTTPSP